MGSDEHEHEIGYRRQAIGGDGIPVMMEWRGKRLGWQRAREYIHDACLPPAGRLETDSAKRKSFSHAEYDKIVEDTVEQLKKLGTLKGGEYAGDDDRLANFRRNGEALNLPMEAVWHTYTAKHWDAVTQYIRDLVHGKSRERLEPLAGRLDDIIVYCVLFKAMLAERGLPISPGSKK